VLVQEELIRRGTQHRRESPCGVVVAGARPWDDAVDRVRGGMSDSWDYRNALG
jgi:hypothetical protein